MPELAAGAAMTPVRAVTAADPYGYYAGLVAKRPSYRDPELGCWVFSSAATVSAALAEPSLRVRPATEPVPLGIAGTAAGEVFGNLVRMTDGPNHDRLKQIVLAALGTVTGDQARALAGERARSILSAAGGPDEAAGRLQELMFALPAQVVARLCGLDDGADEQAARLIGRFVQCLPATASPEQLAEAARAAEQLAGLMGPSLDAGSGGLLAELVRAARRDDWAERGPLLANGIGLLSQTYDASAGLIGNSLLAVARQGAETGELTAFVSEVARHDSPVHNTRRFAHRPVRLAGCSVDEGESVLLLLAAANRDPAANPEPERFRPERVDPVLFTFGAAGHGCPGQQLAVGIACGVVQVLIDAGIDWAALAAVQPAYRPSGNIRIPVLPELPVAPSKPGASR